MKFFLALLFCANALFAYHSPAFYVGLNYMYGYNMASLNPSKIKDYSKARKEFKNALKDYRLAPKMYKDNLEAYSYLGVMAQWGYGEKTNPKKAFKLYKKGAELGNKDCQTDLGMAYDHGIGVKQDGNKAIYWYKKAIAQGDISSYPNIASIYIFGKSGAPMDKKLAYKYLVKCSDAKVSKDELYVQQMCRKKLDGLCTVYPYACQK